MDCFDVEGVVEADILHFDRGDVYLFLDTEVKAGEPDAARNPQPSARDEIEHSGENGQRGQFRRKYISFYNLPSEMYIPLSL